jgi:hypothetical protein
MTTKKKLFIVDHAQKADYKVYFVAHKQHEQNAELIYPGELVQHEYQADVKVFIVDHGYKADIQIMRKDFPT